jgi:cytidine deaminase
MSEDYQTTVTNTGSQRSAEKVRKLSPEQLNLSLPNNTKSESKNISWKKLQEEAVNVGKRSDDDSVGCAVLDSNGDIYTGVTLKTPSETIHAAEVATLSAVSNGEASVDKAVVYTNNEESLCGSCRQLLYDFSDGEAEIRLTGSIEEVEQCSIRKLLP